MQGRGKKVGGVGLRVREIWKMFYDYCLKAVFGSTKIDFRKTFLHSWVFRVAENVGQPKVVFRLTIKIKAIIIEIDLYFHFL